MLRSLRIENFRCFQAFELQQLGRVNLLVGTNNSGKTSILEAIRLLLSSSQNLESLSELMLNRSEYTWHESHQNDPMLDIRHLFYSHEVTTESYFSINGLIENFSKQLTGAVQYDEKQMGFFDSQLNQVTDLYLVFNWDYNGERESLKIPLFERGISLEYLRRLKLSYKNLPLNIQFVTSSSLTTRRMLELFDQVVLTPEETLLYEALDTIEPKIERIASVSSERYRYLGEHGGFVVRLSGSESRVPIGSLGDGIWRMLGLALSLVSAKGGVLLVDEIDTGLHFSVMSHMWKLIWETATRLNVQVFATTHNSDCWTSLAAIASIESPSQEGITIQRIEKGKPNSIVFTERQVVIAAEQGIEVR